MLIFYIKSIYRSGNIIVKLVTSKSRVIPMKKKYSIPRLELLGAFISSKLMVTVLNALKEETCIDDCFCYTDSQIALAWILSINKELKTFCQNRVDVIRKNVDISKWSYVKSSENPADIITRFNDCDLSEISVWFKGPKFLYLSENYDKKLFVVENDNKVYLKKHNGDISKEVNSNHYYEELHVIQTNVSLVSEIKRSNIAEVINITNYSELQKLLRVTSYVLRFVNNIKRKLKNERLILKEYISTDELKESLYLWLKDNQALFFSDSSFENRKRNLMVDVDENGLYRSMGRLGNASLSFNTKFPMLLNNNHYLTELIVKDSHSRVLHNGFKHTLAEVRKNYWIIRGRNYIKKILRKCVICNKVNSRSYSYPGTSNLPKSRIDGGIPFNYIGVDYFGPLYYKAITQPLFYVTTTNERKQMLKCYVILYTCTTTRGILLDLVKDGNTKTLINSLRTFIARRGCPKGVISDNAKVFSADETQTFCSSKGISWDFNLSKAPWQGGFWERLIALCKRCLKKVVGRRKLTFDELKVIIFEIESILNNRPLCYVYDDIDDIALTPNSLLFGRTLEQTNLVSNGEQTPMNYDITTDGFLSKYKHLEKVINEFWDIWRRDYLLELRQLQKINKSKGAKPKVNDIVIIYEENIPRQLWKLGRIVEIYKSNDGRERGAKVKVGKTNQLIDRPLNKLFPLELNSNDDDINDSNNVDDSDDNDTNEKVSRPKRAAAIVGEMKRKFLAGGV